MTINLILVGRRCCAALISRRHSSAALPDCWSGSWRDDVSRSCFGLIQNCSFRRGSIRISATSSGTEASVSRGPALGQSSIGGPTMISGFKCTFCKSSFRNSRRPQCWLRSLVGLPGDSLSTGRLAQCIRHREL